jgi:hypothetical protein
MNRRSFFSAAASLAAGTFWTEETLEALPQNTNTSSKPSDLKITDLRVATVVKAPMTCHLIRIDTNQGITGYGEVRDGASKNYALMLKSRLVGENPCNIDRVFRKVKQFGFHARQAGGVCGVEMALWDLAGKAFNVPAYQMAGGKFRDTVRLYADTDMVEARCRVDVGIAEKMNLGTIPLDDCILIAITVIHVKTRQVKELESFGHRPRGKHGMGGENVHSVRLTYSAVPRFNCEIAISRSRSALPFGGCGGCQRSRK